MNRREFVRHLHRNGCVKVREASSHAIWRSSITGKRSTVPRHTGTANVIANKICKGRGAAPIGNNFSAPLEVVLFDPLGEVTCEPPVMAFANTAECLFE